MIDFLEEGSFECDYPQQLRNGRSNLPGFLLLPQQLVQLALRLKGSSLLLTLKRLKSKFI